MGILFKKKKIFMLLGISGIVLLGMTAPYLAGYDNDTYTVFDSIQKFSQKELQQNTIQDAFACGSSSLWFYLIAPILASFPMISYISDEWESRFLMYEKAREGTWRYLCSRFAAALGSGAVILFVGLGIFLLALSPYFPLNPVSPEGQETVGLEVITIGGFAAFVWKKFVFLVIYSFAISLLASLLVLLYNDLFFDLSVTFILNYLFRDCFIGDRIQVPLAMAAVLIGLYIIIGKKGRKI